MDILAVNLVPNINDLEKGNCTIHPDAPIWRSKFKHAQWFHTLPNNPLYKGPKSSHIDWQSYQSETINNHPCSKYTYCLTNQMVLELKITAIIHSYYPRLFRGAKTKKTILDAKTVKGRIAELAKIGSHMIKSEFENGNIISSFSDITFEILKKHAPSIGGRPDHLKRALRTIATEAVQKNLPLPLKIKLIDVESKSIYWGEQTDRQGIPTLSDAQFLFLLSYCKQSIAEFKIAMDMDIHDQDIINNARREITDKFKSIQKPLEDYIWGTQLNNSSPTKICMNSHGYTPVEVRNLYNEAHKASMLITILLTGMRDTEFSLLKIGSLKYQDSLKYLTSRVVKQQNEGEPPDNKWLAIPLVEDAYEILSYACSKTGNKYLFSSPSSIIRSGGQGYATLNLTFNRWITKIDHRGLFKNHTFSVHQCRETLAYQLAKYKVGLPFISRQLKHFYNRFNRMPNEVTAGYGNYRKSLDKTIQLRMAQARKDVLMDMYGENNQFAGGGGEIHKIRIDAWFRGAGLFGSNRERYIAKMANSNIALMPTSIGVCNHNFIKNADGEAPPPCYGDFTCDPDCPNHVISEGCSSALLDRQRYAESAAKADDENALVWVGLAVQLEKHVTKFEKQKRNAR